jgi:Putative adhesin
MKRFFSTSTIAIALLILAATTGIAQDELHKTYPLNPTGTISLTNVSGSIRIIGWSENRVQVDAVKRGNKDDFSLVEIQVSDSPQRLEITTNYARANWRMNRNVSVEYELKVPRGAILNSIATTSGDITITNAGSRVTARSTSGTLSVRGLDGDTNLHSTSGDITAEHINGVLTANSTSGNITATDLRDDVSITATSGEIRIEKAGGRVNARATSGLISVRDISGDATLESISDSVIAENIKGRVTVTAVSADVTVRNAQEGARINAVSGTLTVTNTKGLIEAKTTSGDVIVSDVDSHEIQIGSHSGNVSYSGTLYNDGRYSFQSFNGGVTITIPATSNFALSATTFSGSIETDFPITIPPGTTQTNRPKRLQGTHGNGGAQLKINGFSADIKLKKK